VGAGVSLGGWDGKANDDDTGVGTYAWVTNEPWSFTNWSSNRPNGNCTCKTTRTCACNHWLTMVYDGTWKDGPENTARPYICEALAQ
jgi:hypothetical protein